MAEPPFAAAHLLYTFTGSLPSGEIWSVGLRTVAASVAPADLDGFAVFADNFFSGFWNAATGPQVFNPPTVQYLKCTVRQVDIDGMTLFQSEHHGPSVDVGGATGQGAPNQTALVVTTKTSMAGRSGRGRFYLPCLTPALGATTGRLPAGETAGLAGVAATLINKIGTSVSATGAGPVGPFPIAIQSRVAGKGAHVVTSVQVGDVCDTQRRRRDKVVENYSTAVVEGA